MLSLSKYQNKKIAIYGMGLTGFSTARTLKRLKVNVCCWDDNKKIRQKVKKSNFTVDKFWLRKNYFDNIVISPGIDITECPIKDYLKKNINRIITDLDIFFEINNKSLIISITGTNGKSTTCKIIEKILRSAKYKVKTLGNIGKPILSTSKVQKEYIFILEVSSYQLEYSKIFRSKHAAILNISPDHLERHNKISNYIKIKSRIFFGQNRSDYSYINLNNKYVKVIKKIFKKNKLKSKLISINGLNYNFLLKKINNKYFKSEGNIQNLAFAYEIAKKLKVSNKIIIKAINEFKGLSHRQEVVCSNKKILCINDSKATSFDASLQSLLNYKNIYWIVGGLPKKKDKFFLNDVKNNIKKAYVVGEYTNLFEKIMRNKIPYVVSKNLINAVNDIYKDIYFDKKSRPTILLSPAAASFDQYKNFETRGNFFIKLIKKKFK